MISPQFNIFRTNKMGKPYVQSTDPSATKKMSLNDMWLDPDAGTMKMWNGTEWVNMQFGESAIMDDCIANRVLANDISASKITTGVLQSQDGSFVLDLTTGEATLLKLVMGGTIEGNIIAMSSNGLTRVRLRGKEGDKDITAGLILEQREEANDEEPWQNAGQVYFAYNTRQSYSVFQHYHIGAYNGLRPDLGYNGGTSDGLTWRAISLDWLRAAKHTYHGLTMCKRDTTDDTWQNVKPVETVIGNCMVGTSIACEGTVTCTYQINDIMKVDFNLKIVSSGSASSAYGISRNLLRQLNNDIPIITPVDGGTLQVYGASGNLMSAFTGASLSASGDLWTPSYISNGALTNIDEALLTSGITIVGTCYGTYSIEE